MNTADFFSLYPVFNLDQAREHLSGNARRKVFYAIERGRVIQVRREIFAVVPPGIKPEHYQPVHFLVMKAARPDAVMAGHTALELNGGAYSMWNTCDAYSNMRRNRFRFQSVNYRIAAHPTKLVRADLEMAGLQYHYVGRIAVPYLGRERCVADGFDRPRLFGGVAELTHSLHGLQMLDFDLLGKLLDAYSSHTLNAAVGWFLERNRENLYVPETFLDRLADSVPKSPHYLDRKPGLAQLAAKWNLIIPMELCHSEFDY